MGDDGAVRRIARRRYWREADARAVVAGWRESGRSLSSYCSQIGVKRERVSRWAARLEAGRSEVRFHPVAVVERTTSDGEAIELELSGGERLRLPAGFEAEDLRRILLVLNERRGC